MLIDAAEFAEAFSKSEFCLRAKNSDSVQFSAVGSMISRLISCGRNTQG